MVRACYLLFVVVYLFIGSGCAPRVIKQSYPVYQVLPCPEAEKPELLELDENLYISSKKNMDRIFSNFNQLNLYIERLQVQIQCYKAQEVNDK